MNDIEINDFVCPSEEGIASYEKLIFVKYVLVKNKECECATTWLRVRMLGRFVIFGHYQFTTLESSRFEKL